MDRGFDFNFDQGTVPEKRGEIFVVWDVQFL
jgi:hypothetical protein